MLHNLIKGPAVAMTGSSSFGSSLRVAHLATFQELVRNEHKRARV